MAEPTNMLDALVSAINAEGGGASPTHVAPNTEVLVDSSQETPAQTTTSATSSATSSLTGGATTALPDLIEVPGPPGRPSTFMNPAKGATAKGLQEATGWTLGTSISRRVSGAMQKVLKTKWRLNNSSSGEIVVGFAAKGKDLLCVHYDESLVEFGTTKIQTRLPIGRYQYPEPTGGQWDTLAGQPRTGTANYKWMLAANNAMRL